MEERIIRLPELITYHRINEVWEESIACFCTKSDMKNISKIPPVLADMFSFIVVEEGMAHYILNYKEYNVQKGDMLLFSPSMLVSLTGCTDDFRCMNLMCERSLFEHMLVVQSCLSDIFLLLLPHRYTCGSTETRNADCYLEMYGTDPYGYH